ncbi:hypothetical protein HO542_02530 [Streptococcus suis]|uniref:hypothetical protein n=1 Tax=Streptococcus suis TaxID=1307 RepID=UPI000CF516F9|nr:hypothetical protein [Streptococcus suis]NQJ70229.1 hypothetical protein [Streptococcus suis]
MSREHPLKERIEQRLEDERYVLPEKKKKKRGFDFHIIITLSVLISLGLIIFRIIQFFFK